MGTQKQNNRPRRTLRIASAMSALAFGCHAAPAAAEAIAPLPKQSARMSDVAALVAELREQRSLIDAQNATVKRLQLAVDILSRRAENGDTQLVAQLADMRAAGLPQDARPTTGRALPDHPVGEAPPPEPETVRARVEAVPEGQGVLTPGGHFVLDTSFEYTNSSANRLVFRGFELIPGLQVGLIEASEANRDTLAGTVALRYGISSRLEIEARMSALYRSDRIQVAQQRDASIVRTLKLSEYNIGDAELAVRYQLNAPQRDHPIWIANLRIKSDTGKGPFDVGYDEFGVATGLATGSGFWGIQPGVSFLLPSDPVVIYGGLNYLYNAPKNIDRVIGGALVGRVDPGDAINANVGFGFALNPRFSFSLGYQHSYIFPSRQVIGGTSRSQRDQ